MSKRQFFLRVLLFLILFFGVDLVVGKIYNSLYNRTQSGDYFSSRYGWEIANEEIIIIGASEVAHGFISNQISDSLDRSCVNLGRDGLNVYYHYALLNSLLDRYTPDCIIISTSIIEESTTSITGLFPYYKNAEIAKQVVLDVDNSMKYKLLVNSYLYNSTLLGLIQSNMIPANELNGYVPIYAKNRHLALDSIKYDHGSSGKTLEYFQKMIKLAVESGAKVFIVDVPKYQIAMESTELDILRQLTEPDDIIFVSYMNDTTFLNNPFYFKDRTHLKHNGASIFTSKVSDTIEYYLRTPLKTTKF